MFEKEAKVILYRLHIGVHLIRFCLLVCILIYFTGCSNTEQKYFSPIPYRCTPMGYGWVLQEGHRNRVFALESDCLARINPVIDSYE